MADKFILGFPISEKTASSVLVQDGGNVGIGIDYPIAKLHVYQNDTNTGTEAGVTIEQDGTGDATLSFLLSDVKRWRLGIDNSDSDKFKISDSTDLGTSNRLTIDTNGNVGIGTTSPGSRVSISLGTGSSLATTFSVANNFLQIGTNDYKTTTSNGVYAIGFGYSSGATNSPAYIGLQQTGTGNSTKGDLVFRTRDSTNDVATTERMRITSGGDLRIGKSSSLNNVAGLMLRKDSGNGGVIIVSRASNTNTQTHINFFNSTGGSVGRIQTSGSTTSYVISSDYRLKENVVPMKGALDRVDALKPSRFNFIADPNTTVDGFIAHEAAEVVPEAVTGEKDALDEEGNPQYQGIDQSKLVPLLVAAIQELKAEVELLKLNN